MAAHTLSSMCDLEAVDSQMHLDQTSQKVRLFWEALNIWIKPDLLFCSILIAAFMLNYRNLVLPYEYYFPRVTWTM